MRSYRQRNQTQRMEYQRGRSAGRTGLPLVACAVCGAPTGRVESSEPGRRRVCSTMCRSYLRNGTWPQSNAKRPAPRMSRDPKPKPKPTTMRALECQWCGSIYNTRKTMSRFCKRRCRDKSSRMRRISRENQTDTEWRWSDFMRVARKFDYCCAYCGIKPERLDPDHVVALSRGGDNAVSNMLPTCMPCNSDKRHLTLDEWAADRARRNLPPRSTIITDDIRYAHLALRTPTRTPAHTH